MKHSEVRPLLYDFLMDDLKESEKRHVGQHLASCNACTNELNTLRDVLQHLHQPTAMPSDERDASYWQSLGLNIEKRISLREQSKPHRLEAVLDGFIEKLRALVKARPFTTYGLTGAIAALVIAVLIFRSQPDQPEVALHDAEDGRSEVFPVHDDTQNRMTRYFRKSRVLFVGFANMDTDLEHRLDLSAERRLSRDLVQEARYLKQQPLDGHSVRLVDDLERILIELANLEESNDLPQVEIIRSGIKQENLLFKIRMAEASFDTINTTGRIF